MIKELENKVRIKEWIKLLFGADGVETGASESINEGWQITIKNSKKGPISNGYGQATEVYTALKVAP